MSDLTWQEILQGQQNLELQRELRSAQQKLLQNLEVLQVLHQAIQTKENLEQILLQLQLLQIGADREREFFLETVKYWLLNSQFGGQTPETLINCVIASTTGRLEQ